MLHSGPLTHAAVLSQVMTKPPSLAKRRGAPLEGANRYRLLFSLWNTSTLSYVSWQHMATPLVSDYSAHAARHTIRHAVLRPA